MEIQRMKSFAKSINDLTFTDYFNRLSLLARSVFKWNNLPHWIDEKWIETFLFNQGYCVFWKNEKTGLTVTEGTICGNLNNYDEPTEIQPTGIGIESPSLTVGEQCVIIRNNDDRMPTSFAIKLFAYRLATISRTIDVNINAQKTPVLVIGSEKQKLTLKNIYTQWNENEPVIYGDKSLDGLELLRTLNTSAPIVFPELQTEKQCIWNECLTFLGINNANTDKRERLITDEVEANNNHIDLSADCFLKSRQRAAEQINKLFGTKISVEMREHGTIAIPEEASEKDATEVV